MRNIVLLAALLAIVLCATPVLAQRVTLGEQPMTPQPILPGAAGQPTPMGETPYQPMTPQPILPGAAGQPTPMGETPYQPMTPQPILPGVLGQVTK